MKRIGLKQLSCIIVLFVFAGMFSELEAKGKVLRPDTIVSNQKLLLSADTVYNVLQRNEKGLIIIPSDTFVPFDSNVSFADTMFFNPEFLPIVFDGKIIPDDLTFMNNDSAQVPAPDFHLIDPNETFAPALNRSKKLDDLRRSYYMKYPSRVDFDVSAIAKEDIVLKPSKISRKSFFQDLISSEAPTEISAPESLDKYVPKKINWIYNGEHTLQVAQNYISKNWNVGGNSSFYIRNYHKLTLNYKKDKLRFNNTIEWKLNLQQTPADTVHNIGISEDLIRIVNTLGLQAFNNKWSYTATMETKTQLFDSYPINKETKNTALLSPLIINLGIGMDYSLEKVSKADKYKKFKLTQNIAPLTLIYTYVGDEEVNETKFGVEEGKKSKLNLGSSINTNMNLAFNRYTSWTSRFKYLTNYRRVEVEFENKFDMALNRFLTTTVSLYLRYDDNESLKKDNDWGLVQVNELISFGLTYKW